MRIALTITIALLPVAIAGQDTSKKEDPSKLRVEVTGCLRGSTLTETNLRVEAASDDQPSRRWRVRGPKALMRQIKDQEGKELAIVGTTKSPESLTPGRRIGRTNIFIGGDASKTARDPLPEPPTVDIESFEPTGETCR